MNKNVEGLICENQFTHPGTKGITSVISPASYSCNEPQSKAKGNKLTTGLILFSLFLLFLFF